MGLLALAFLAMPPLVPSWGPFAAAARRSLRDDNLRRSHSEPGFTVATSDEELADFFKANLDPDLAPWRGRSYRVAHMLSMLRGLTRPRNHTYLDLRREQLLHAPVFAIIKPWDRDRSVSADGGDDILLPHFHGWGEVPLGMGNHGGAPGPSPGAGRSRAARTQPKHGELVFYPWERKISKALMRATLQKGGTGPNTRKDLVILAQQPGEPQRLLDVGATGNNLPDFKVNLSERVPMPDHAHWRYLLSADGNTASSRLGKLLAINSVVLKEDSAWIEHYYRSVVPYTHVVPFTASNVLEVIKGLQGLPDGGRSIGAAGQRFVCRFASHPTSAVFVGRALWAYAALFERGELGRLVRGLELRGAAGKGEGEAAEGERETARGDGAGEPEGRGPQQWDDEVPAVLLMGELLEQMEAFVNPCGSV
ncbi:hypothetical protein HYH03_016511 [Edaphochlamys debaryana]|uniref:Glycosyl transferase CAP10 domain-containing protein n=1 Tax=Edaphochlamys debaryana TaxID=47281 RepID=A0A835XHC8_9CHLO|nr:hypothetical protein HYH03_016511 [Edaphochlamys debaryana]|eukprot:KAG2484682.1 hypothetical protein HYH03_016511 [Edaphochlamys debaryana]